MKEYVYKINHKFIKHPILLTKYGFNPYTGEDGEDLIVAKPITIDIDSSISKSSKNLIEYFYKHAEEEEKETDFKEYKFYKNGKLILNKQIKEQLTKCQLCFYTNDVGAFELFINAPDHNQYFNATVLDEHIKKEIDYLLSEKVIYRKKIHVNEN